MRTDYIKYKADPWVLFKEIAGERNLRKEGRAIYLSLSKKNANALTKCKKDWNMTWNEWATEILELIEEHG